MFGEYWVLETAAKAYAALMDASGSSMLEFLSNLNALHDRITGTFLNYIPPEFRVESTGGDEHRIHYISQRQGLTPFVVGLLNGLSRHFGNELEIQEQQSMPVDSGEHTIFKVVLR
jgi:guanylate cyclase soluble subunit beta